MLNLNAQTMLNFAIRLLVLGLLKKGDQGLLLLCQLCGYFSQLMMGSCSRQYHFPFSKQELLDVSHPFIPNKLGNGARIVNHILIHRHILPEHLCEQKQAVVLSA